MNFYNISETQKSINAFEKYAVHADGSTSKFLTETEFRSAFAIPGHYFNNDEVQLLFSVADKKNDGRVTMDQFIAFEEIFQHPFPEYTVLSLLIDPQGCKSINVGALKAFLANFASKSSPVDFKSQTIKTALGSDDNRKLSVQDISQLVKIIRVEKIKTEFIKFDPKSTGFIQQTDFKIAIKSLVDHKVSPTLLESIFKNLPVAISFGEFDAICNVISRSDEIAQIAYNLSNLSGISSREFSAEASKLNLNEPMTPMEVEILFRIVGDGSANITGDQLSPLIDPLFKPANALAPAVRLSAPMQILKSIYNFTLGAFGGAVGAAFVYPIDLVKTRMQNQRNSKLVGQLLYKNSFDCFRKVVKNEGFPGLYSGLLPQLVGVAPEKAIKLTMNDLVRTLMKNKNTNEIAISSEILAGCCAGGSQVLFTNPLEIVKIRLQVQGQVAKTGMESTPKMSAIGIVRQLGLFGLYKGVSACLLRDIPFSGIYFPVYAHLKKDFFHEGHNGKKLSIPELLVSGAIAGIPAAFLVTPADVIKTRLQVQARKGEQTYSGIRDAFVKILREEGPSAFFKGGIARVFRSSPQFGVTLAVYEVLQKSIPIDFGDKPHDSSVHPSKTWNSIEIGKQNSINLLGDLSLRKP